ncbi:PQQ-binding-like beta-propeller repeat protein [Paracoccaceae bacterium GXU_MW_L88]
MIRSLTLGALALVTLAACGEQELILPGERISIRPEEGTATVQPTTFAAPPMQALPTWPQTRYDGTHNAPHASLSGLSLAVQVEAGRGKTREGEIFQPPVSDGQRIYTKDAASTVRAFTPDGGLVWSVDVAKFGQRSFDGFGGGLALGGSQLFVTTGMGQLIALDAASGQRLWVQDVDAPIRAAPLVIGDEVVVIARDDMAYGISIAQGRINWQYSAAPGLSGVGGGASAATDGQTIVLPYSSGQVNAVEARNRQLVWQGAVVGGTRGLARAAYDDITADPVIAGDAVYLGSQAGQIAKLDKATGDRIWTASFGSFSPVVAAGDSVFATTDMAKLIRLDAATGALMWQADLPRYRVPDKRRDPYVYYGPVLAGGGLLVAGTDGLLRMFDPSTGQQTSAVQIPGGAAAAPIVVNGTAWVLSNNGQLLGYR